MRGALEALAARAGVEPAWHVRIEKRLPVAAGIGGGSSDAAAALRLANETLAEPLPPEALHELAAGLGADVPFFLADGPQLGTGDGSDARAARPAAGLLGRCSCSRATSEKPSTRDVYAAFDRRGGADGWEERRGALLAALERVRRPRDLAALPANDLASSPLAGELAALGAFRADVTGAGPAVYGLFHHEAAAKAAQRALKTGRAHLADGTSVVRLTRAQRLVARDGTRARRLAPAAPDPARAWIAAAEGLVVLFSHDITKWTVIVLAVVGSLAWLGGRESRSRTGTSGPLDLRRVAAPGRDPRDPRLDREDGRSSWPSSCSRSAGSRISSSTVVRWPLSNCPPSL